MTGRLTPRPTTALGRIVNRPSGIYRFRLWFIWMGLSAAEKGHSADPCAYNLLPFFGSSEILSLVSADVGIAVFYGGIFGSDGGGGRRDRFGCPGLWLSTVVISSCAVLLLSAGLYAFLLLIISRSVPLRNGISVVFPDTVYSYSRSSRQGSKSNKMRKKGSRSLRCIKIKVTIS